MAFYKYRGKRIRASDRTLVYRQKLARMILEKIDAGNDTEYLKNICDNAKLTEKHDCPYTGRGSF